MAPATKKPAAKKAAPKVASKAATKKAPAKKPAKAKAAPVVEPQASEPFVSTPTDVESIVTDTDASTVTVTIAGSYGREAMLGLSKRIARAAVEVQ